MSGRPRGVLVTGALALAAVVAAVVVIVLAAGGNDSAAKPDPAGPADGGPAVSGPAASVPPGGRPPAGEVPDLDEAERALAARLSTFVLTDCRSTRDPAGAPGGTGAPAGGLTDPRVEGVQASLRCVPGVAAAGTAPAEVIVLGYADEAAMDVDAERRAAMIRDTGSCEAGQSSTEAYRLASRRMGTFVCEASPGRFAVYWTVDRERVAFSATTADPPGLIEWWRQFDPL